MKLLRKILATSLALIALPSAAVSFSTPVAEEDYENHIVHFLSKGRGDQDKMGTCSGMLMGGKYLLSAGHCFDGDIVDVEIFQGVDRYSPDASYKRVGQVYQASRTFGANLAWQYYLQELFSRWVEPINPSALSGDVRTLWTSEWWYSQLEYGIPWLLSWSDEDKANPIRQHHNDNDFAFLVLDESVPHHSGLLISPLLDLQTSELHFTEEDEFVFRGYGYEAREPATPSQTLREGTMRMYRPYLQSHIVVSSSQPAAGQDRIDMCDAYSTECFFRPQSFIDLVGIDTGLGYPASLPGDSGGAITRGDYYFGSMYGGDKSPIDGKYLSVFSDVSYLMDWFSGYIQDVVYPSDIGVTIAEGDSQAHEIKIPVQNFTDDDLVVSKASVQGADFTLLEDCEGILRDTEGCMITVLFNGSYDPVNSEVFSTINLGITGANALPISVRFKAEDVVDPPEVPDISCDEDPWQPGCFDMCDLDWYAPGCPPVECSVDPYQDKCTDTCEFNPLADECTDSVPTNPDNGNDGNSGDSDDSGGSGGSGSLAILTLLISMLARRRLRESERSVSLSQ
ncbi:hypothetical protein [Vibrio superstes]|uniref:Peptidase S1 domain-containing protein n=1 Tax=Vibrio superstes NBRC 103154 TaxID=1219062 RepID=A0A511QPW8_9VIBR|nr:hypothetical protein [Vibrio superstes]GEM79375.1 hypothetical protein VSU01S_16200 [Vibrio superstes NBRC 103154]